MPTNSRCNICRDRQKRDLVLAALRAGDRPSEILARYPDLTSSASLYRHCRSHVDLTPLSTAWLDGSTSTGEVVADLARLRVGLLEQYRAASARGASTEAVRAAHEAAAVSATLLRSGIGDDATAKQVEYAERVARGVQRAARNRPEFALELADAARQLKDHELADDADALAESASNFLTVLDTLTHR